MKRIAIALALLLAATLAFGQNTQGTLIPSFAYTATVASNDQTNLTARGVTVVVNISSLTSGTNTCTIQGKDPVSGNYYTILASSALNSTGTTVLKVYPGITTGANAAVSDILPTTWRLNCVGASSPSYTFSAGFMYAQ